MAEGIAKSLKNEEDACDDVRLSSFSSAKMVKKEEPSNNAEDDEDRDNVPLSKSRVKKSKNCTSKVNKEDIFEQINDKKVGFLVSFSFLFFLWAGKKKEFFDCVVA